jgi:hypothetical protein
MNLRRLAAIDLVFLGSRFVLAEYAVGLVLCLALGLFVLFRSHSYGQVVLGIYFIGLGANYAPMLGWAVAITKKRNAEAELSGELSDKHRAMAKYRRLSLVLLIPLSVAILMITQRRSSS